MHKGYRLTFQNVNAQVSRRLKLPNLSQCQGMSGGQAVEHMAQTGDPNTFELKHYAANTQSCDFSFAGMESTFLKLIADEELKYGRVGIFADYTTHDR